ncbi:MAG: crotonase/enoyl-CoA hydratase family protein [Pikeienuella sp.]
MNLDSAFFRVERDGAVAHLIMARGDKANAMNTDFWNDLPRLTRALEDDPEVRAMVISGEGKHFTSGMDLSAFQNIGAISTENSGRGAFALRRLILKLQDSFTALDQARFPVIAAIHGACLGGGIDMITACDMRLATTDAYFSIEEINIGMAADVGTFQRLPKLIAPGIVRELAFTGRKFSAEECKEWGLVNSLHADRDAVIAAAMAMAQEIAAKSPLAIGGIKQSLNYIRDHSVEDGLDQIATWNAGMLRPEDLMKAIQGRATKQAVEYKDLMKDTAS